MQVSLGPDAEKLIEEKLRSGQYATVEAVLVAGLEALDQQVGEDFAPGELDALLAEGKASLALGGPIPAEDVFEELRQRSLQRRERRE